MNAFQLRERLGLARRRPALEAFENNLQALDREVVRTRLAYEKAVAARMDAARPITDSNPPEESA